MHAALLVMVGMSLGVDVGWQSLEDGGVEYIIQLDAQALEQLRSGEELRSDLPPFIRDQMRSYRIKVGEGALPRDMNFAPAAGTAPATDRAVPTPERATEVERSPEDSSPQQDSQPDEQVDPATVAQNGTGGGVSERSSTVRPPRNEPRYPAETPLERRSMPAPADADVVAEQPPRIIEPDPSSTALVNHESSYREGAKTNDAAGPSAQKSTTPPLAASQANSGRWWPLTGALLTLFVSLGGNAYLGMQWWSARQRCQELLHQLRSPRRLTSTAPQSGSADDEDQDVQIVAEKRRR